ncbi:MAG TPA: hypothetical protein VKW06_16970 [Candidatus Angelobacter sp.]|nr:hypothetical protein [Candidatus Angelobacter sp.]
MTKNRVFVASLFVLISALAWAGTGAPPKDEANATAAFAKMKNLVGQWEADTEKGKVTSTYELVSNGTALVEHVNVAGEGPMVTVYYLDGSRLVLTHYCTAGNQPRMQAESFDPASNRLSFDFVSASNLAGSGDGHMHSVKVSFQGPDAFISDWTFYKDGKAASTVPLQFRRVR